MDKQQQQQHHHHHQQQLSLAKSSRQRYNEWYKFNSRIVLLTVIGIFRDVPSDITIEVNGGTFALHKHKLGDPVILHHFVSHVRLFALNFWSSMGRLGIRLSQVRATGEGKNITALIAT
ncbi:hypothetical protein SCA6_014252 [Theobroma cacao]